jgi:hypothetical protein
MKVTKRIMLIPVASLLLLSGCVSTAGYKKPISDFQEASTVITDNTRNSITQLNKILRDAYIDQQASEGGKITPAEIQSAQILSRDAIKIRIDALAELAKYGVLLGKLANSDAPEQVTSNANKLAMSLGEISGDVQKLSGSNDKSFKDAFGPAAMLMGEVARFAVEKKIEDALNKAILGGEKPILTLIEAIESDLTTVYDVKRVTVSNRIDNILQRYEKELLKGDTGKLRNIGDEIKSALDVNDVLLENNPSAGGGVKDMKKAIGALVKYAKSPKTPNDLATFAAQMEIFAARAKRVSDAAQKLQQLDNNK